MSKWDARDLALAAAVEDAGDAKLVGDFVTVDFDDENKVLSIEEKPEKHSSHDGHNH